MDYERKEWFRNVHQLGKHDTDFSWVIYLGHSLVDWGGGGERGGAGQGGTGS
jgi:hypothetical protein